MSTSHLPHAALTRHGIHLVPRSEHRTKPPLLSADFAYKLAAAGVALILAMTVC
jgi:hypothetical protein